MTNQDMMSAIKAQEIDTCCTSCGSTTQNLSGIVARNGWQRDQGAIADSELRAWQQE